MFWKQGMKCHHIAPTNLTELWTALANIWQDFPVQRFQKLVESMPRRVAANMKANGNPTGNNLLEGPIVNSDLHCIKDIDDDLIEEAQHQQVVQCYPPSH
ncbi:hypothetical protein TNCV_3689821 [Trichonephila clavipes]|uniref:Uncharacterized protein n=1 Tax=Trichonephila clavipes TaxID=2585209 RepID=A0A8X6VL21_TRICX|nr:hypothetical protein TNCV_3689821 [Trichonephila clavipes]